MAVLRFFAGPLLSPAAFSLCVETRTFLFFGPSRVSPQNNNHITISLSQHVYQDVTGTSSANPNLFPIFSLSSLDVERGRMVVSRSSTVKPWARDSTTSSSDFLFFLFGVKLSSESSLRRSWPTRVAHAAHSIQMMKRNAKWLSVGKYGRRLSNFPASRSRGDTLEIGDGALQRVFSFYSTNVHPDDIPRALAS